VLTVQDHAAGAFEEQILLFQRAQVDGALDGEALAQHAQYALAAFQAAVLALHRVEHQAAVGMAAPAVVGEDRVRGMRFGGVLYHQYVDAVLAQAVDVAVELFQGLCAGGLWVQRRLLEAVVGGGVGVEGEPRRANHEDGICCLHWARIHGWAV
jgi:hypothetical protein